MAIEEPAYDVVRAGDGYELRRYAPYIVAETEVEGSFSKAGSKAFRILADYIFGNNSQSTKMAMTAPVESASADAGVKMAMTAPVESRPSASGPEFYTYAFVMEDRYTLQSLPQPNDARITLRQVEARTVAVRRYSGRWTESNYRDNERALLAALKRDGIPVVGAPTLARFNGPFTPWFLRRNEVQVEVALPTDSSSR